ncbi:MAG: hypothetical protein V3V52_08335 [Candidatus Adiutricales bacterium]
MLGSRGRDIESSDAPGMLSGKLLQGILEGIDPPQDGISALVEYLISAY